jgi:hypothetical protein
MRYVEALGGLLTVTVKVDEASFVLAQSAPLKNSPVTLSELVNSKA